MRQEVPQSRWREELDSFSRRHEGWIVSIKTRSADGQVATQAHDLPLQGVSADSPRSKDVAIVVGKSDGGLMHEVHDPLAVAIELSNDRAERALIIDSRDGKTTTVEFRSPMRPEEVDGVPAADRR